MNNFPNKLRSHNVYDEYKAKLQKYRKVNQVYSELKSEAMKSRHWKIMLQKLKLSGKVKSREQLMLLDLWNADLIKNNKVVADIMAEARGELILEEFIKNIKETWSKQPLELIWYKSTSG
jgi:dynein heavy chain 1